jgi:hypothetical protein
MRQIRQGFCCTVAFVFAASFTPSRSLGRQESGDRLFTREERAHCSLSGAEVFHLVGVSEHVFSLPRAA